MFIRKLYHILNKYTTQNLDKIAFFIHFLTQKLKIIIDISPIIAFVLLHKKALSRDFIYIDLDKKDIKTNNNRIVKGKCFYEKDLFSVFFFFFCCGLRYE